jgi:hypothetical protein
MVFLLFVYWCYWCSTIIQLGPLVLDLLHSTLKVKIQRGEISMKSLATLY